MPAKTYSVAVIVGSDSDLPVIEACLDTLEALELPHELRVLSAHRSPDAVHEFARGCEAGDAGVIIAATGVVTLMAAGVAALLPAVRDA